MQHVCQRIDFVLPLRLVLKLRKWNIFFSFRAFSTERWKGWKDFTLFQFDDLCGLPTYIGILVLLLLLLFFSTYKLTFSRNTPRLSHHFYGDLINSLMNSLHVLNSGEERERTTYIWKQTKAMLCKLKNVFLFLENRHIKYRFYRDKTQEKDPTQVDNNIISLISTWFYIHFESPYMYL